MLVMNGGKDIVLNTEGHGVMRFPTSKLSLEGGTLSLEDLETIPDQKNDSYSPTCLFADEKKTILTIMSYSETDKKLKIERRKANENYIPDGEVYSVECPHTIMKACMDYKRLQLQILDIMGNASIFDIEDQKILSKHPNCTGILAI